MPPASSLMYCTALLTPSMLVWVTSTAPPCWLKYPTLIGSMLESAAPVPPTYAAKSVTLPSTSAGADDDSAVDDEAAVEDSAAVDDSAVDDDASGAVVAAPAVVAGASVGAAVGAAVGALVELVLSSSSPHAATINVNAA